ncbi:MAG TPA: hypothetical protein VGL26_09730 [Jatrophihabitans sp.]
MAAAWGQNELEQNKQELLRLIEANRKAAMQRRIEHEITSGAAFKPGIPGADEAPVPVRVAAMDAALLRLVQEIKLVNVLDEVAMKALLCFDAISLIVDRTAEGSADIEVLFLDGSRKDLWELDPLMWDEANDAAMQYVAQGEKTFIRPKTKKA